MKALILVDIQNDFLPGGTLAVSQGDQIIPIIDAIQTPYDLVVATQDWHPADHKSFASQHDQHSPFDEIELNGLAQTLWPDHCVQGTHGADISMDLQSNRIEAIFRKGMDPEIDSYSGFYDNGRRKNTGLHGYLRDRNVTSVAISGLAADFCVFFTAMDALDAGFEATILAAASRAIDPVEYEAKKALFVEKGGVLG